MTSVIVLFLIFCLSLLLIRFAKHTFWKYLSLFLFGLLLIETAVLGVFLTQIYRSQCYFLIGNDRILDQLIKARLIYATYFVQGKPGFLYNVDNELGYTLGRSKVAGIYESNSQGFRARRDYTLFPDEHILRVVTLGDSYVFCDGEKIEDSWPYMLENLAGNLEVLNFGVGGYGLGQSYLRYLKDAMRYHADVVFVNYLSLTGRDMIDWKIIAGTNNLRQADFYRVKFQVEDGVLKARAMAPYDLFEERFRRENIFDEDKALREHHLGWLSRLRFCNTGILLKQAVLIRLANKIAARSSDDHIDEELQYAILKNFLNTIEASGAKIIFFGFNMKNQPPRIKQLLHDYEASVVLTRGFDAGNLQIDGKPVKEGILNSSNHYNAKGNLYYARAVLDVLKAHSWGRGGRKFVYQDTDNSFVNDRDRAGNNLIRENK